jgi:murein DD-endopeptidase MepM/ murein hydrolase activator NlpD
MPHRSAAVYHRKDHHAHSGKPRLQPAAVAPRPGVQPAAVAARLGADYTLLHAGRQLRLGPIAFWVVVGTLVVMAGWTLTTATYFAFREDVLTRLISRQTDMQYGYEDRIAELRAQVDRMSSRQLLDQEQYEQKLDQIVRRQTALESRAAALNGLSDTDLTGTVRQPQRNETPRATPFRPSPIKGTSLNLAPVDHGARLPGARLGARDAKDGVEGVLAGLQQSLDRVEARQSVALQSVEQNYNAKVQRMHSVLTEVGIDPNKIAAPATGDAIGGPFIAARPPANASAFERQVWRANVAQAQAERLKQTLRAVPLRKPVMGEMELSSGFGVRIDPFVHGPAMHTGLDFRGDIGDPVRVTASGRVTSAGWSGGYGKMVEVDHGNGLVTRYGHLSAVDAHVGQTVKPGQIVGRLGSTGRSTGPHLHYETRVSGEAVDPLRFLRAGSRLATAN